LSIAPEHARALANKEYYLELLRNRTSNANFESSDLKLLPITIKNENLSIKNQRPRDYLEERESYEQLCRQNGSNVKDKIHSITIKFSHLI
jgi:hypothetical protein